jgi:hypothetical protein
MVKKIAAVGLLLCLSLSGVAAQTKSDTRKPAKPAWTELTPAQQTVLAPLQAEWEQLDTTRRKKWLVIADRYPTMKPPEQQRLQKRMQEWSNLTPAERAAAREKYKTLKKLPPNERKEVRQRWKEYEDSRPPAPAPAAETPPG